MNLLKFLNYSEELDEYGEESIGMDEDEYNDEDEDEDEEMEYDEE